MEDMATGEIRLSILWEWLHKGAALTADDDSGRASRRVTRSRSSCSSGCSPRNTTSSGRRATATCTSLEDDDAADRARDRRDLPHGPRKLPWYIDLLNITLGNGERRRGAGAIELLQQPSNIAVGQITENVDFDAPAPA